MNIIATITDADIGENAPVPVAYEERRAARAIVFDRENIALLHATKKGFHKLPGGGVEEGEDVFVALHRELLEEIGCTVGNLRELGIIEEYRNGLAMHQVSYCYVADIMGEKGEPKFEEDEIADGFVPEWTSLDSAIKILESEADIKHYEGKFIRSRDLRFLQEYAKNRF